jgi:RNA polymerase sigma-70 factor
MTSSPAANIPILAEQSYAAAYASHGNLQLTLDAYVKHILSVIEKHLGVTQGWGEVFKFFQGLYTDDLYVAIACAQPSESAWSYFVTNYGRHMYETARAHLPSQDAAKEVVDFVLADLSLPDRSGRSRIASYDGRSPLAGWIRVVIVHQASKERNHRSNSFESIECVPEMADQSAAQRIEAEVRGHRYHSMVCDSMDKASRSLSDRERLILLLRYDEELQAAEIARILRVSRPTITRSLQAIHKKLRDEIVLNLASRYSLSTDAIEECITDMQENPEYSILTLVKQS